MRLEILSLEKLEGKNEELNLPPNAIVFKVEVGDKEAGDVYTMFVTIEYKEDNGNHSLVLDGFVVPLGVEDEKMKQKYNEIVDWVLTELKSNLEDSINTFVKNAEKLLSENQ